MTTRPPPTASSSSRRAASVSPSGDLVHVRGAVSEFNGLTEITAGSTEVCGTGATLPAARQLQLPADDVLRESLESMYVALSQSLVDPRPLHVRPVRRALPRSEPPIRADGGRGAGCADSGVPPGEPRGADPPRRWPRRPEPRHAAASERPAVQRDEQPSHGRPGRERDGRARLAVRGVARAAHAGGGLHGRQPASRGRARGRRHDGGLELQRAQLLHVHRAGLRFLPRCERPRRSSTGRRRRSSQRSRRSTPTSSGSSRSRTTTGSHSTRSSRPSTPRWARARTRRSIPASSARTDHQRR